MTGPPERGQKEAPKGVDALRGAKGQTNEFRAKDGPISRLVKVGEAQGGRTREATREAGASRAAVLPCLNRNNSNEPPLSDAQKTQLNNLSTAHRKTAFALAHNVARMCSKYGVERIGFLTLTFKDHVTCAKEAGRRFNSLRTGVLAARYVESIAVLERMKSGRIHFHLLVVLPGDIRTGFDFDLAAKGTYTSANSALRAEWAFWRSTAPNYRFGRTELMPVKSNEAGLSKYVGKYIAKHIDSRETRDKGVRLVRYSGGSNPCGTKFMFHSHKARLWRWQVGEFARLNGCVNLDALKEKFGKRWAHTSGQRAAITRLEPPPTTLATIWEDGEAKVITLWEVWHAYRVELSQRIAAESGCTQEEAFVLLFQPWLKPVLDYSVPAFSGVSEKRVQQEEQWERVIVWADGRVDGA